MSDSKAGDGPSASDAAAVVPTTTGTTSDAPAQTVVPPVLLDAEGRPLPDIRSLTSREYLSMILFRAVRCSMLGSPFVFALFGVEQAAHALVREKARCGVPPCHHTRRLPRSLACAPWWVGCWATTPPPSTCVRRAHGAAAV
jgi:hypothetical protein